MQAFYIQKTWKYNSKIVKSSSGIMHAIFEITVAKLKIPDPVKWHNYVLWTYRIIKFQWWRPEPKGTIYTRSDEGRFLLPTQHSIIQWLWVVTTTCLGRGSSLLFSLSHRFSTAYAFYRRLPSVLLLCRGLLLGLPLSVIELNVCSFTLFSIRIISASLLLFKILWIHRRWNCRLWIDSWKWSACTSANSDQSGFWKV